jgi:hypothetical protein
MQQGWKGLKLGLNEDPAVDDQEWIANSRLSTVPPGKSLSVKAKGLLTNDLYGVFGWQGVSWGVGPGKYIFLSI